MDEILLSLAREENVGDAFLRDTVERFIGRAAAVRQCIERARLQCIRERTPRRGIEKQQSLARWIDVGEDAVSKIRSLEKYLEAKMKSLLDVEEEGAVANHSSLSLSPSPLTHSAVQRCKIQVQRAEVELCNTIWQAKSSAEEDGTATATSSAERDTIAARQAMQSLIRTRAALSREVLKVEGALHEIQKDTTHMATLRESLLEVGDAMSHANRKTAQLKARHTVDRYVLIVSWVIFGFTVAYVLMQRLLGFFPVLY